MLLPAADFASFYGFRRLQGRMTAPSEVWRLDFPFTLNPTFVEPLGERHQVSTPSPLSAEGRTPLQSAQRSLARDWHRSEEDCNHPFERKAFPVFDACSPRGFPRGDPFFLFPLLLLVKRGGAQERRVCCVYRFRHSRSRKKNSITLALQLQQLSAMLGA